MPKSKLVIKDGTSKQIETIASIINAVISGGKCEVDETKETPKVTVLDNVIVTEEIPYDYLIKWTIRQKVEESAPVQTLLAGVDITGTGSRIFIPNAVTDGVIVVGDFCDLVKVDNSGNLVYYKIVSHSGYSYTGYFSSDVMSDSSVIVGGIVGPTSTQSAVLLLKMDSSTDYVSVISAFELLVGLKDNSTGSVTYSDILIPAVADVGDGLLVIVISVNTYHNQTDSRYYYYVHLIKMDYNFNVVNHAVYAIADVSASPSYGFAIYKVSDGYLILLNNYAGSFSSTAVVKINASLEIEWVKNVSNQTMDLAIYGITGAVDGYVLVGAIADYSNSYILVTKITNSGSVVWSKKITVDSITDTTYYYTGNSIVSLGDGKYAVFAAQRIIVIDDNGTVINAFKYSLPGCSVDESCFIQTFIARRFGDVIAFALDNWCLNPNCSSTTATLVIGKTSQTLLIDGVEVTDASYTSDDEMVNITDLPFEIVAPVQDIVPYYEISDVTSSIVISDPSDTARQIK